MPWIFTPATTLAVHQPILQVLSASWAWECVLLSLTYVGTLVDYLISMCQLLH